MKEVIYMPTNRPRINVTLEDEIFEQISNIAAQQNTDKSKVVRNLIETGLNLQLSKENLDFVTDIIRTQLQDVLHPYMDRIISLQAKTCIQAGASAYLSAEAIRKFVPEGEQMDVKEAYDSARKKAVEYTRRRVDDD